MESLELRIDTIPEAGRDIPFRFGAGVVNEALAALGVGDAIIVSDLEGNALVLRSGEEIFVTGRFKTVARLVCVRCLAGFEAPIESEFHVVLSRETEDVALGEHSEVELDAAALEIESLEGETIHLDELVIEQLVLSIPPYPLCREGCAGICPGCGADLNTEPCACETRPVDPRLAALTGWKPK